MKKSLLFFAAILIASTGLWANTIYYTATSALSLRDDAFDVKVRYHSFVESTGKGVILFDDDVTKIGDHAFERNTNMLSIEIPHTVTTIGKLAFAQCSSLVSITFEGTACQYAIGENAFFEVGSLEAPAALTLPDDWHYATAPSGNGSSWYGGYFSSNLYSSWGDTDKESAKDVLTGIMNKYPMSNYLQSLLENEIGKINDAVSRLEVNEIKQAASDKLQSAVFSYIIGVAEGKADVLGSMATVQSGPVIEVIDQNGKVLKLYNPKKVNFIK